MTDRKILYIGVYWWWWYIEEIPDSDKPVFYVVAIFNLLYTV